MAKKPKKGVFLERFKVALTKAAIDWKSPTAVGEFLGLNKQTVDRWLKGGEPSPEFLFLIADKTNVNPRWLAGYDVPIDMPLELSPEESEVIVQIYRVLQVKPKALRKWIRDGNELVEISTPPSINNPFAKTL